MLNRLQMMGAQAIKGAFRTVATSVAEAEAYISNVQERLWRRALNTWIDVHALPDKIPLRREASKMLRVWKNGFQSPLAIAFNCGTRSPRDD